MDRLNLTRTVGAFITTIAILLLAFSIFDLFNKVDYIVEYDTCTNVAYNETTLSACKINASTGLGFKVRENQLRLSVSQYLMVYLTSLMKILFAITVLIIGTAFYSSSYKHSSDYPEPVKKKKKR